MESGSHTTDRDLIRRVHEGDDGALAALLTRHEGAMLARVRRRLHPGLVSKIDPEDVLQEVYLVVARRIEELRGDHDGSFGLWLSRIVDFKVREAMRRFLDVGRRDVRAERGRGMRPNTSQFRSAEPSPSQVAMGAELAIRAQRALDELPADYRRVLELAQVEGASLRDVASTMGRSYEATKKLYGRAVARFRVLLDPASRHEPHA